MHHRIKRWLRGGFRLPTLLSALALLAAMTLSAPTSAEDAEAPPASRDQSSADDSPAAGSTEGEAADGNQDGPKKWVPALTMGFMLHVQDQEASVVSGMGSQLTGTSDGMVSPGFRFGASIATPVLAGGRVGDNFAPRLFAHAGAQILLEDQFTAYRAVDSYFFVPGTDPAEVFAICGTLNCTVQTRIESKINSQWYLGTGLQIVVPLWQRQLRLRTAVDYFGQSFSMRGESSLIQRTSQGGGTNEISIMSNEATSTTHALGLNLQADAMVYRWRDLRVSLFLETRFAWLIESEGIVFTAGTCGPVPVDWNVQCSNFAFSPDPFIAQGGGGIRFSWLPSW